MNAWHKVTLLTHECTPLGKMMQMQDAFQTIFIQHGRYRRSAALFCEHTLGSDIHDFYFSPDAVAMAPQVIAQFGAVPGPPPWLSDEVRLCIGHSGAREALLLKAPEND